jgi:hypothetical protein
MALLGKKSSAKTQIPELQEYYATQKKESTGLAWLLALGSLLITAAIFIGLFLGGRWIYRSIKNDDKPSTVAATQDRPAKDVVQEDGTVTTEAQVPKQPTETVTVPTVNQNVGGSVAAPAAPSVTPAQGVTPSQSTEQNSTAVAATTEIPNTGSGSILGLFVVVLLAGAYAHRRHILNSHK